MEEPITPNSGFTQPYYIWLHTLYKWQIVRE